MPSLLTKLSFYDAESGRYFIVADDGFYWKNGKKSPEESKVTKLMQSHGWQLTHGNDIWLIFKKPRQRGELTVTRGTKEWYYDMPGMDIFENAAEGKGLESLQQALESGKFGELAMAQYASAASTAVNNAGNGHGLMGRPDYGEKEDSVLMLSGGLKTASGTKKTNLYVSSVAYEKDNLKLASFRFSSDPNKAAIFPKLTAANLVKQIRGLGAVAKIKQADEHSLNGFLIISLDEFAGQDEGESRTAAEGDDETAVLERDEPAVEEPQPKKKDKQKEKEEEFGLGSTHREMSDEEMREYMGRIKNKEKDKLDKFNLPILHGSNIHIVDDGGKEYDLEALKKEITTAPSILLQKNEKMKHSDGTAKQFYNVGIPALKGLVVNEKTGKFVIVDTCPGAGACKTQCYAMRGGYVQYPKVSMGQSQRLNLLVNNPKKFGARLKAEIGMAIASVDEGNTVGVRWHDAGDFFSPQYMNMAYDVARAFPDVEFYAYTKVADVANSKKPDNFVINFSEGALPSETKKVDLTQIKKSTIVPQKMFWDLIVTKGAHTVKNEKGQVQFKNEKTWDEFKDRLVAAYKAPKDAILIYDDYMEKKENGELGDKPKWSVVVPPGGGDQAATDPLVLVSFLMWH